jgi:hypothetical protein
MSHFETATFCADTPLNTDQLAPPVLASAGAWILE